MWPPGPLSFTSAVIAFIAGFVLWWLGIYLSGILAALQWPAVVVTLSKMSKLQALYLWQVAVHFVPMCLLVGAASFVLFRIVGTGRATFFAAVLPYILLSWAMGSFETIMTLPDLALLGLSLIALLAFPLGVLFAWQVARRRHLTPPSSGHPPAGFAI